MEEAVYTQKGTRHFQHKYVIYWTNMLMYMYMFIQSKLHIHHVMSACNMFMQLEVYTHYVV